MNTQLYYYEINELQEKNAGMVIFLKNQHLSVILKALVEYKQAENAIFKRCLFHGIIEFR